MEGGIIGRLEKVGAPVGTVVSVEELFYNVPARLKFLKQDITERRAIDALVTRYALAYPQVRFKVIGGEYLLPANHRGWRPAGDPGCPLWRGHSPPDAGSDGGRRWVLRLTRFYQPNRTDALQPQGDHFLCQWALGAGYTPECRVAPGISHPADGGTLTRWQ